MYHGKSEEVLTRTSLAKLHGKVQLIFTSPPFPLNRKKKYGNMTGDSYVKWIASLAPLLTKFLTPTGSVVIELGNAWEEGTPTMSTLSIEALLAFKKEANLHLCQEFICFNPARLPTPAQWVTIDRVRVKDSFTRLWWMSPTPNPKADNRRVLREYSDSMKKLLKNKTYNAGKRKSEHSIGETSFLKNNKGAIPPNVFVDTNAIFDFLVMANTQSTGVNGVYQRHCDDNGLTAHPARMQMELAGFFVKFLTDEGDIVLDPFGGSNTTGYISESLKRKWIAVEASDEYIEGSKGRFFSAETARKIS
jgi:site-specific DNA-methyltransferase (cytosine-N4-specific)